MLPLLATVVDIQSVNSTVRTAYQYQAIFQTGRTQDFARHLDSPQKFALRCVGKHRALGGSHHHALSVRGYAAGDLSSRQRMPALRTASCIKAHEIAEEVVQPPALAATWASGVSSFSKSSQSTSMAIS